MRRRTSGYATLTVTTLMTAISLIAVSVTNLALTHSTLNDRARQTLSQDILIESQLHETLAGLVNGTVELEGPTTLTAATQDERTYSITIEEEAAKIDLRAPDENALSSALQNAFGAFAASQIVSVRETEMMEPGFPIEDLLKRTSLTEPAHCYRRKLTTFHNSLPPTRERYPKRATDGAVLTLRLEGIETPFARGLEASVLLTGRRDQPALILSWRPYDPHLEGVCET